MLCWFAGLFKKEGRFRVDIENVVRELIGIWRTYLESSCGRCRGPPPRCTRPRSARGPQTFCRRQFSSFPKVKTTLSKETVLLIQPIHFVDIRRIIHLETLDFIISLNLGYTSDTDIEYFELFIKCYYLKNDTVKVLQILCKDFLCRPKPFETLLKFGEQFF